MPSWARPSTLEYTAALLSTSDRKLKEGVAGTELAGLTNRTIDPILVLSWRHPDRRCPFSVEAKFFVSRLRKYFSPQTRTTPVLTGETNHATEIIKSFFVLRFRFRSKTL